MKTQRPDDYFEKIALIAIIVIAAIMRFYNLESMSFSNDELSSLTRIRYDSFAEMIDKGVYIDFHPAGLQTFLFYWVKIFGDGQFIVRFPFVICSLASIWLIYHIGKKWFNGITALFAAAAFAFLSFTILFTQLARMYSPGIMFTLLTVFAWTNFLYPSGESRRYGWYVLWIVSMSINLHLHYFSFLIAGLIGISGLFLVRRQDFIKYFFGGIIALLTFLPEIPVFLEQMKTGDIGGWLGPPSVFFIPEFFYELFNRSVILILFIALFLISGIVTSERNADYAKWRIISLSWFLVTFLVAYLYSILGHPVLTFSTLLFATPFLLLTIFSFLPRILKTQKASQITFILFSFFLIYDTTVPAQHYSKHHFGVFKEVAEDAQGWVKKYGKDNVPIVANVVNPEYLNYYFREMNPRPEVTAYKIETTADLGRLFEIAGKSTSGYFAYVWTNSLHPLEISGVIRTYYPYLIGKKNYFNASSYLFGKQKPDKEINNVLFSSENDYDEKLWPFPGNISSENSFSPPHSEKMENEFSSSLRLKSTDIPGQGYRYVTFKCRVFPVNPPDNSQLVISFERKGKSYDYHGLPLKNFVLKTGSWQQVILSAELPKDFTGEDELVIYSWNPSHDDYFLDDMDVKIYEGDDPYEQFFHWKRNLLY